MHHTKNKSKEAASSGREFNAQIEVQRKRWRRRNGFHEFEMMTI
jgi:hypothetical protein